MKSKGTTAFLLAVIIIICGGFGTPASREGLLRSSAIRGAASDTALFLTDAVKNPTLGAVEGDWAVFGLARSGYEVPDGYFETYYANVVSRVQSVGGVLHERKHTEFSRVILALTAIGKDPTNVGGYNLLIPLGDFDKTVYQGVNGAIYALLALDSGSYDIPTNVSAAKQATRDMYVSEILSKQNADGGFSLSGASDPDITAMVLQALAKYQTVDNVKSAVERALAALSAMQGDDGGFSSYNSPNSESEAQVLTALCELGIGIDDSRFLKNGVTVADKLLSYYVKGKGFRHLKTDAKADIMSTEQAFCALVGWIRMDEGKPSLFRMSDRYANRKNPASPTNALSSGLPGKNTHVAALPILYPGKTFDDIKAHKNNKAIEALAERGIISGVTDTSFAPDANITRAQFAAIAVRALGLPPKTAGAFRDVLADSPYAAYIDTAFSYGIVSGIYDGIFAPNLTITRGQAAVMTANAAKLCGLDVSVGKAEIRDILSVFADYTETADWERSALAFCYKNGILPSDGMKIDRLKPVTRAELAQMVYLTLKAAMLI